jgi:hypothetical protein
MPPRSAAEVAVAALPEAPPLAPADPPELSFFGAEQAASARAVRPTAASVPARVRVRLKGTSG